MRRYESYLVEGSLLVDAGEEYSVKALRWQRDAGVETTSRVWHLSVENLREGAGVAKKCLRRLFVVVWKGPWLENQVVQKDLWKKIMQGIALVPEGLSLDLRNITMINRVIHEVWKGH